MPSFYLFKLTFSQTLPSADYIPHQWINHRHKHEYAEWRVFSFSVKPFEIMCVSLQSEWKGSKKCSWFWCIYTKNEFRNFFNFSESLIEKIVTLVLWVSSVVHRNKGVFFAVVLRLMWWCFSACECLCGLLSTWERAACDRPHRKHIRGNSKEPTHVYILILTSRASYLDLHLSK